MQSIMTTIRPLRYFSGRKTKFKQCITHNHLDFGPEEYLNKNLGTTIEYNSKKNEREELQGYVTKSFRTFGSADMFSVALKTLHLNRTIPVHWRKG